MTTSSQSQEQAPVLLDAALSALTAVIEKPACTAHRVAWCVTLAGALVVLVAAMTGGGSRAVVAFAVYATSSWVLALSFSDFWQRSRSVGKQA